MRHAALRYPPLKTPDRRVIRKVQALSTRRKGQIAAIEPESGEYFISDSVIEAARKGREKFPGASFYFVRIGYPAVDFQSGGLQNR